MYRFLFELLTKLKNNLSVLVREYPTKLIDRFKVWLEIQIKTNNAVLLSIEMRILKRWAAIWILPTWRGGGRATGFCRSADWRGRGVATVNWLRCGHCLRKEQNPIHQDSKTLIWQQDYIHFWKCNEWCYKRPRHRRTYRHGTLLCRGPNKLPR